MQEVKNRVVAVEDDIGQILFLYKELILNDWCIYYIEHNLF
jgi:hypothetical protein